MEVLERITVNEQSSIRIAGEKILYFDPFRIRQASHDGDVIFITHAHFDHFSPEDIAMVKKADTVFVLPESMRGEWEKSGPGAHPRCFLRPGDRAEIRGIPVEAVPAYNTNKPMHPKKNGWLGYIVTVCGARVYVCGDTDDTPEGRAVKCNAALVPVGGTYTMNASEAAAFVNAMRPKAAIPTHYGTVVGTKEDGAVFEHLCRVPVCRKLVF